MRITYGDAESNAFDDFRQRLDAVLTRGVKVCDVGGGAHPCYNVDDIRSRTLDYTVLDISRDELSQAPEGLRRVVCDIQGNLDRATDFESAARAKLCGQFDVVFSSTVAEHIADPCAFHTNIFEMLRPGGSALHLFPTLPTIPFVLNKFLPERLSAELNKLSPVGRKVKSKFPAFYRWCSGPTTRAIQRFENLGWEVVEYRGFFGHTYYRRFPPLFRLHGWKTRLLERYPLPGLTNYALVWLRKPAATPNAKN